MCIVHLSFLAVIAALAMTTGCSWSRNKINDTTIVSRQQLIQVGTTPIADVPSILAAAPSAIVPLPSGGNQYSFVFGDSRTNGLNLILFNFAKTNLVTSAIYITSDKDGIVNHVSQSHTADPEWQWWPFGE